MRQKNHLQLYLSRYAEAETETIANLFCSSQQYDHCLVIPALNENPCFIERILNQQESNLLLVVVINQPDSMTLMSPENQHLWDYITDKTPPKTAKLVQKECDILVINRFHQPLPAKQGVGLARKIGCDVACALHHRGQLKSHWVHNTDADAQLPSNYWFDLSNNGDASALIYPFQHQIKDKTDISHATQMYEQSLNYYVDGLRFANSPYAFHTLGSCIAISIIHYAKARGFPKRAGGEDFYLLNKLAKLGNIENKSDSIVKIEARHSDRAPFGTGATVSKILKNGNTELLTYHPQIFYELNSVIKVLNRLNTPTSHKQWLKLVPETSQQVLIDLGISKLVQHLKSHTHTDIQYTTAAHHWFDAFRTLKYVHKMEAFYPKCRLKEAQKVLYGWDPGNKESGQ